MKLKTIFAALAIAGVSACTSQPQKPTSYYYPDRECNYMGQEMICGDLEQGFTFGDKGVVGRIKYGFIDFDTVVQTKDGHDIRARVEAKYYFTQWVDGDQVEAYFQELLLTKISESTRQELVDNKLKVMSDALGETEREFTHSFDLVVMSWLENMVIADAKYNSPLT